VILSAAVLAGCGSTKTVTTTVTKAAEPAGVVKTAQQQTDEDLIRQMLPTLWSTVDNQEGAAYCNLLTKDAQRDVITSKDPNSTADDDGTCEDAASGDDGPASYADAKVLGVFPGRDTAMVILDDGGPDPLWMQMAKEGGRWKMDKSPYWYYQHKDPDF
jgi:hypothetical protein